MRHRLIIQTYKDWISRKDNVLDVGCGHCRVAEKLKQEIGCKITGTDILDYCKGKVPFKKMSKGNKLPFKNNEFDITILNDVLHHSDYHEELIKECLRVSNKLFIFEAQKSRFVKFADRILSKLVHREMNTPLNFRTLDEWKELFEKIEVQVKQVQVNKPSLWMPATTFGIWVEK